MATIVFDLDGVIYIDGVAVPGASEMLRSLTDAGHQLLFATNNATRRRDEIADMITEISGFAADPESVVTSAMATAALLQGRADSAFIVGEPGLTATLADAGIRSVAAGDAQAVVVGLDRQVTYDKLRDASLAIRSGAAFIATNLDETYPTASGLWPGGGALVAALEASSGVTPELAGKPAEPMRQLLRRLITQDPVWVVGDRPDTDLALGFEEGWSTALVMTGVTDDSSIVSPTPTAVLASVADLASVL